MKEQILAVQRMQDYIAQHLGDTVTLSQLAGASLFSPWHSYRLFKAYTGMTPADYIRRLRLSKSAQKLKNEKAKIADVAFELGFQSVDGYQRAFLREFGRNPHDYAKEPSPIYLFTPYGVKFRELKEAENPMSNAKNVFVQMIDKPARRAIIKRGRAAEDYFAYCDEVGCDVWGLLCSMEALDGEPVCLWLPDALIAPGTSRYVQGVETALDSDAPVPEGFDAITLEAGQFLMFQGEPFREEDYSQAICDVQQAMNRYDPSLLGYEWNDALPRVQLEPRGQRGYIELRGVKPLKAPSHKGA